MSFFVFNGGVAEAAGLEAAVLHYQLMELYRHVPSIERDGFQWLHVETAYLSRLLPFFSQNAFREAIASLRSAGYVQLRQDEASPGCLMIAIILKASDTPSKAPAAVTNLPITIRSGSAKPLDHDFAPSEDTLLLLETFHQIPRAFATEQLEDFKLYWIERGQGQHAWQNKFKQHVQRQWAVAKQGSARSAVSTRKRTFEEDLSDTTWAH